MQEIGIVDRANFCQCFIFNSDKWCLKWVPQSKFILLEVVFAAADYTFMRLARLRTLKEQDLCMALVMAIILELRLLSSDRI